MEQLIITMHQGANVTEIAQDLRYRLGIRARCNGQTITILHDAERVTARTIMETMRAFRMKNNPIMSEWPTEWPTGWSEENEIEFKNGCEPIPRPGLEP